MKLFFTIVLFLTTSLSAQSFGKNKMQYRDFDWSFIQTPHFDIYYYGEQKDLAEFAAEVAEESYEQISIHLRWDLKRRVSIMVYNSHNEFQQTNVVGAYMPTKEMGGGSGLKYAASTIVYLSKAKEKDGTDVVGNLIRCETKKSRFTRENKKISTRLFYDERGLDKYYGMIELGLEHGVFEKTGNRIKVGESSVYPKAMLKEPEKYFTPEIMKALDDAAKKEFSYGS